MESGAAPGIGAAPSVEAMTDPTAILDFWFAERHRRLWFARDDGFDAAIRATLGLAHEAARAGRLDDWRRAAPSCLALVLLLDQVPRNIHRGTPLAFAADPAARAAAQAALARDFDMAVAPERRLFFYLPFCHSESPADQELAVQLMTERLDDPEAQASAREHAAIIRRFGRFLHRNRVLGRTSTEEEEAFLAGADPASFMRSHEPRP